jgi:hypothetical protein
MKLVWRQKIGLAMIVVAAVVAVVIQVVTRDLVTMVFTWRYALPLAACAGCGFFLLLVPSFRRPPS